MIKLEQLAEQYLTRRGRVVLPRCFIGIAVGFATAVRIENDTYTVRISSGSQIIALNHSIIVDSRTKDQIRSGAIGGEYD